MSVDRYKLMADRLNRMQPGQAWRIPRHEIADLPGLPVWAQMSGIVTGFERVKQSVVGSAHPHIWQFRDEPNGDVTAFRLEERA